MAPANFPKENYTIFRRKHVTERKKDITYTHFLYPLVGKLLTEKELAKKNFFILAIAIFTSHFISTASLGSRTSVLPHHGFYTARNG